MLYLSDKEKPSIAFIEVLILNSYGLMRRRFMSSGLCIPYKNAVVSLVISAQECLPLETYM